MVGFFQENENEFSLMRLISFICVCVGCAESLLGCYGILVGIAGSLEMLGFAGSLITAGFTGKLIQKASEAKTNGQPPK
jgi:hypothetical protein